MDLSDLMDQPDVIDLEKFSFEAPAGDKPAPSDASPKPPEPEMSPDVKALLAQVQQMQQDFEGIKQRMEQAPPQPPQPTATPPRPPEPPTDEEIEAAIAAGDTIKGIRLAQQQYAMRNFVPAMMRMAHQVEEYKKQHSQVTDQNVQHMAARAVQDYVHADPRLLAISGDIYDAFRDMPSNYILQEGVIENVVSQVIGRKAREGTWTGGAVPTTAPTGHGAPTSEGVSPMAIQMFKNLTGIENVDAGVIEALMHPRAINIGRGEG